MMQTSVPQPLFLTHGPSIMHTSQSPVDPSLATYRTRLALDRPISHRFSKDLEELQWDALKGVEFDEDESMYRVDEEDEDMDGDEADDAGGSRHDNSHHHRSSTPSDRPRSAENQSSNLSFALSERADIILANAKKKLSVRTTCTTQDTSRADTGYSFYRTISKVHAILCTHPPLRPRKCDPRGPWLLYAQLHRRRRLMTTTMRGRAAAHEMVLFLVDKLNPRPSS